MRDEWKSHDRLLVALLIAGLLHGLLILGISFEMPKPKEINKTLDVVLVVNPTPKPPVRAEFLASEAQKGGGEAKKKAVPKAIPNLLPVIKPKKIEPKLAPPPRRIVEKEPVNPPEPEEAAVPEPIPEPKPIPPVKPSPAEKAIIPDKPVPEENQVVEDKPVPIFDDNPKPVLKQAKSEKKILASGGQKGRVEPEPHRLSADLLSQQIAEVTTEFNKSRETQAKRQRIVYINSVNAHKYKAAAYEADWQEKVEQIGNLNFPDEARRQNLTGSLLLAVAVNADGSIYSIKVRQSSGEPVLDEAAQRIVRMAAPFAPFPPELREEADILVITRTWRFTVGNRIDTGG